MVGVFRRVVGNGHQTVTRDAMVTGTIENLYGLIGAVHQAQIGLATSPDIWWRGHSNEDWSLVAGVHREKRTDNYERNIANRFYNSAQTRHSRCPAANDYAGWLFLMQHYGLPTRLLDWSKSPLIAAFFVVNNPNRDSEPGALWALLPGELNKAEGMSKTLKSPISEGVHQLYEMAFSNAKELDRIAAVLVPEQDLRMLVQLSTHTIHGVDRPIEAHEHLDRFLMKWIVPSAAKPLLRAELALVGIRTSTVFPDLQHLAKELTEMRFDAKQQEFVAPAEAAAPEKE